MKPVDPSVRVGSVVLPNPVILASGTAGYGAELAPFIDLGAIGAITTKSLAWFAWAGNPAPRVHPAGIGMLNAVGLQGGGVEHWLAEQLPPLLDTGARVIASIWGRSIDDFRRAADMVGAAPPEVIAVEVNLSCPNLEGRRAMFAHDAELSAAVIEATSGCGRPRWAKLSPNTDRVVEVASAVSDAGAEAVTLVNTALGMVLDEVSLRPALGAGGGGLSGEGIHPIAVRTVHDVRAALPSLPIIGVGGVTNGWHAIEFMAAGANAVGVGTASFADPRAGANVSSEMIAWLRSRGLDRFDEVIDAAHASP